MVVILEWQQRCCCLSWLIASTVLFKPMAVRVTHNSHMLLLLLLLLSAVAAAASSNSIIADCPAAGGYFNRRDTTKEARSMLVAILFQ